MNRSLLPVVLLPLALVLEAATPTPSHSAAPVPQLCPDRSPPSLAAISYQGCNVWMGELLYSVSFGLHAGPDDSAVIDTIETFASAPEQHDTFLGSSIVSSRQCTVDLSRSRPNERQDAPVSAVRRAIALDDFLTSDCRPAAGSWQYAVAHYPPLVDIMTQVVRQFGTLATELADLKRDRTRLAGIFGEGPVQGRTEGDSLRANNRPRDLARLALDLARANRSFLQAVAATLTRSTAGGTDPAVASWANAVQAQFPSSQALAGLGLEDRVATLIAALAAVRPGSRR